MKLSQHNACQIVTNINEIINQKMNLINANGIIIASTDESRIGTYHAGAKKLISEGLDELIINNEEGYEGSLPGINYPLIVNGELIGVVGVTGNDAATLSCAKIIKRMTELLIQELSMKEKQEMEIIFSPAGPVAQAKKALHACLRTHLHDLRFYDDLNMEIFTDELSETVKSEYVHKIFKGMNDEEIFKAVQLLEIYYDEEGSISRAADKLFIHKNTLQNRLKQIQARTGYDPRSIRHSSLFYNALHFYREL
ncbi:MAG: CdaR family transcriptional regulator [Clostridium sp.]